MTDTQTPQTHRLWVAYGASGAVGTITQDGETYNVRMLSTDDAAGSYPSMEIAKNALHARLTPGSAWPEFRAH